MVRIIKKGMQGSTDGRIDPSFKKRNARIHGPPIWSEFYQMGNVGILEPLNGPNHKKGDAGIHRRSNRSEFLKGDAGIHGPPIWSEFQKGNARIQEGRIGPNF